ncbi:Major facilitator superfamily [Macrophomina phaseolina MS6]|uniref:Major facilitator superfamily n=1 Tax=Macrophomina phaseolina (strain MS6) TaxID=1126212 RepID=K2S6Q0_MACPH|nr:Major facilitator superfamily [Macrophomina phaseolina MS6]
MVVPAFTQISQDLNMGEGGEVQMAMTLFLLGWGIGPILVAPLSEVYGRRRLLNTGHSLFLVANTLCGFTSNKTHFILLRFVSGLCGSDWRGSAERPLAQRRPRTLPLHLCPRPPGWPSNRPHRGRLHCREVVMAMDILHRIGGRFQHARPWLLLLARNLPAAAPALEEAAPGIRRRRRRWRRRRPQSAHDLVARGRAQAALRAARHAAHRPGRCAVHGLPLRPQPADHRHLRDAVGAALRPAAAGRVAALCLHRRRPDNRLPSGRTH